MAAVPVQPAYDQPIDYQAAGRPYPEPYEGSYEEGYDDGSGEPPRSSRAAMIGVGVAAVAILVIVVSLVTLGGNKSAASTQPTPGTNEIVQPTTGAPASSAPTTPPTTAPTTPTPSVSHAAGTLALGDTGPEVKWLQNRLKQLHFYNGTVSGTFDAATAAAVEAFQAKAHTADPASVVGRSTKTALIAWGSKPNLSLLGALGGDGEKKHPGQNPADVKRLQQSLATALNTNGPATGNYDATTFGAVLQYETSVGLPPDGAVGDKVWADLQSGKLHA
jgi:peptidoglycan hydrolase-like protein with peptidoglycan-binding domain